MDELGGSLSTMVVQELHLWLNNAEMRDAEKFIFLTLQSHKDTAEDFTEQFSAIKKTEAIKHILPVPPPPTARRGPALRLLVAEGVHLQLLHCLCHSPSP